MVGAIAAAVVAVLALNGGGYDIVIRQQVALVIWCTIAVGFLLGILPRAAPDRSSLVPLVAAVALVGWMALSFLWTESDERTTAEIARLLGYLGLVSLALGGLNRYTFRAAAAGLSIVAVGVTGLALASRLFPESFPAATEVARTFRIDRLDYPLDYWNAVGVWAAMTVAIALAWSAHARWVVTRAVCLAVVPAAGATIYVTYSRGGVLGAAVAVVAVLALSRNRWTALAHTLIGGAGAAAAILAIRQHPEIADATGGAGGNAVLTVTCLAALVCAGGAVATYLLGADRLRLPRETARYAVPAFASVLILVVIAAGHGPVSRAWDQFKNDEQTATGSDPAARLTSAGGNRNDLWNSALDTLSAHPLDGTGPGTFEFSWSRDGRDPEFVRDAHSLYLEHLAELGLPGLVLLLLLFGGLAALALRARSRLTEISDIGANVAMCSVFAVFLVTAGVDWAWEETAVAALALGGIAVAGAGSSRRLRSSSRRGPLHFIGVRAAIVALALVGAAAEVPGLVSTQKIRESEAAARSGDLSRSATLARQAVDAEPWAAGPHLQLALVLESRGKLAAAQAEMQEATSKEQTNWRHPLVLARIQAERGNRSAARRTFSRGRKLRPHSPAYSLFSAYGRAVYTIPQIRRILVRAQARQQNHAKSR